MSDNRFRKFQKGNRFEQFAQPQQFDTSTVEGKLAKARAEGRDPTRMGGSGEEQLDRMAAEQPIGSKAATFLSGIPFVGSYTDEAVGWVMDTFGIHDYEDAKALTEAMVKQEKRENPKAAMGLQLGGAAAGTVAALPTAVSAGSRALGSSAARYLPSIGASTRTGRMAQTAALGAGAGAIEGGVYGYGEEGTKGAQRGAVTGAMIGAPVGAAAPLVGDAVGGLYRGGKKYLANRTAAAEGLSPDATRLLTERLQGDDVAQGLANVRRTGPDAMPADAGPTMRDLLDTAIQSSGEGGRIAREAIEGRATGAQRRVVQALDERLGAPRGARATARNISANTQPARSNAYAAAYNAPIDYASDAGRKIEDVLSRVPQSTLRKAVDEANEEMVSRGLRNQQIMASIADDGSVTFREMPNVRQLDELKQSLERLAETDEFGRITKQGLRPQRLASELRDAITEAVPEYRAALSAGGDKIAQDQGLRLGQRLLRSRTAREEIAEAVEGASEAKLAAVQSGVRQHVEDTMANVQRTITDPNVDAREAMKAVKDLSSRANREKLAMILPEDEAEALFREIDRATQALELRASVATNSRTHGRQVTDRAVDDIVTGGPLAALERGEGLDAGKRVVQALTGRTRDAERGIKEQLYAEIARALTEPRGPMAERMLGTLDGLARQRPVNEEIARALTRRATAGSGALGYLGGQQALGR